MSKATVCKAAIMENGLIKITVIKQAVIKLLISKFGGSTLQLGERLVAVRGVEANKISHGVMCCRMWMFFLRRRITQYTND